MTMNGNTELIERARSGDSTALGELLGQHRERLLRLVALRMDDRLRARVDPSDVIQEAYLEAASRLPEYLRQVEMPFYVWLRFLAAQKLTELHRHHLRVQARDAHREVPLFSGRLPEASSALLARQ